MEEKRHIAFCNADKQQTKILSLIPSLLSHVAVRNFMAAGNVFCHNVGGQPVPYEKCDALVLLLDTYIHESFFFLRKKKKHSCLKFVMRYAKYDNANILKF